MNISEKRAKKAAMAISSIRKVKPTFTYEEGLQLLKNSGCPYYNHMMPILIKNGIIEKNADKEYYFLKSDPVFYGSIRADLDKHAESAYNYSIKFLAKKKGKLMPKTAEQDIEEKISFLKQLGYKIFKEL